MPIPVPLPFFSFTGSRASIAAGGGFNFYGRAGVQFYTQTKTITSSWNSKTIPTCAAKAMVMPTLG